MKLFREDLKFYKGNLHTHSTCSDGRHTPEEVMEEYRDHGYDFMAITDHWHVSPGGRYKNMLLLSGVEYDFSFPGQVLHAVCLYPDASMSEGIARGMSHQEVIDKVTDCGGIVIAAHPSWSLNTPDFLATLDKVHISEIYNTLSGEPWNAPRADGSIVLDITASSYGKLFNLVASDDSHFYVGEQCKSYTMLQAEELTVPAIMDALKQGRFYASQGPEFKNIAIENGVVTVCTSPVCKCTFFSNMFWIDDRCRVGEDMCENTYRLRPGEKYIRCVITDKEGRKAWSSPVRVEA